MISKNKMQSLVNKNFYQCIQINQRRAKLGLYSRKCIHNLANEFLKISIIYIICYYFLFNNDNDDG